MSMKSKTIISLLVITVAYLVISNIQLKQDNEGFQFKIEKEYIDRDGQRKIVAFGDSITEGYGLDIKDNYPYLLQEKLNDENYDYAVVNAGLSGDTTAGGMRRVDWNLDTGAEIVIVTLGGNDALRGVDPEITRRNLDKILEKIDLFGAKIIIGGMAAPENLGSEYTEEFNSIYPELAEKYSARLIPFFLQGVALNPSLNLPDGIHPTRKGYEIILEENVWPALQPLLEKE